MENTIQSQVMKIKGLIVSLLTFQRDRLTLNERSILDKLCSLMDDILCSRVYHKRYTAEEFVDSSLMETALILKRTRNSEVKRLVKLLEEGIKW